MRLAPLILLTTLLTTFCSPRSGESGKGPITPEIEAAGSHVGWAKFQGNDRRTGQASVQGPRFAQLKWVFRTRGRIYADAAIDTRGVIYVGSHDGHLYALSKEGREIWNFDARGKIWTAPTITSTGDVLIGTDADALFSLSPDGAQNWRFDTTQKMPNNHKPADGRFDVDTPPAIDAAGNIYFACHNELFALDRSGTLKWRFEAGADSDKIYTSPVLGADETIYFATQGNYLFALGKNKQVKWHFETQGDNDSTGVVGPDGTIYFASDDGKVRALAPGGLLVWEKSLGSPVRAPLSMDPQGRLLASTYSRSPFMAALNPKNGEIIWKFHIEPGDGDLYGIQSPAMIDSEGYIYFGGRDSHVYCLTPGGDLQWKYKTGDQVDAGAILGSDGTLYVGSDDGRLYAFGNNR